MSGKRFIKTRTLASKGSKLKENPLAMAKLLEVILTSRPSSSSIQTPSTTTNCSDQKTKSASASNSYLEPASQPKVNSIDDIHPAQEKGSIWEGRVILRFVGYPQKGDATTERAWIWNGWSLVSSDTLRKAKGKQKRKTLHSNEFRFLIQLPLRVS